MQAALLNVDAKVSFEQTPVNLVSISGTVTANQVHLLDGRAETRAGHELLAFDRLQVLVEDLRPLEKLVKLSKVELTAPVPSITRNRAGRLNLLTASAASTTNFLIAISNIANNDGLTRTRAANDVRKAG